MLSLISYRCQFNKMLFTKHIQVLNTFMNAASFTTYYFMKRNVIGTSSIPVNVQPWDDNFQIIMQLTRHRSYPILITPAIIYEGVMNYNHTKPKENGRFKLQFHTSLAYSKKGCTPVQVLPVQHAYTKVHDKAWKILTIMT